MVRKRSVVILTLTSCLLLLLPALPASALVEKYSLARLAAESSRIVWGSVLGVNPHRNADRDFISSTVTLAAKHYLKGEGNDELSFDIPGGTVDGITQETSDVPRFVVGEEVIVFLCGLAQPVTGWYQGKFAVADGQVFGTEVRPLGEFFEELGSELARQGVTMPVVELPALSEHAVNPSAAPSITTVSPSQAPANTGKVITITGTNFGATQGTSAVSFFYAGSSYLGATVVSWNDTEIKCQVPRNASSHATQGIRVTTSGGTANAGFTIVFGYSGSKWPGTPSEARYWINGSTSDCVGETLAIRKGAWAWNNTDYHSFALRYWGTTSRDAGQEDGYNVIGWVTGSGGLLSVSVWSSAGTISEFDITIDDDSKWSAAATCPPDSHDVQNELTRAFGTALGLDLLNGLPDAEKTMYGISVLGETKRRTLDPADQNGVKWIY